MKIRICAVLAVALCVVLSGCTMAKISGKGHLPLLLNQPQAKVQVVQQVKASTMRVFDYTGAFDASEVLSESLGSVNADAIINIQVTVKTTVPDFLINLITLGIANSRTFEITGQVVKAPNGLGALENGETIATSNKMGDIVALVASDTSTKGSSKMIVREEKRDGTAVYSLVKYHGEVSN